jgi:predicted RNase H-like HicB family nuclease
MKDYLAVLERANDGSWSASVPVLPGRTSAGTNRDEVARNVRNAITLYLEELRTDGKKPPERTGLPEIVHVV